MGMLLRRHRDEAVENTASNVDPTETENTESDSEGTEKADKKTTKRGGTKKVNKGEDDDREDSDPNRELDE